MVQITMLYTHIYYIITLFVGSHGVHKSEEHKNNETLAFENISTAFVSLISGVSEHLEKCKFETLRRACVAQTKTPNGAKLSPNVKKKIKNTSNIDELLDILVESPYCSWIDLRLLEALVAASGSSKAKSLLSSYKEVVFSKKLFDVLPNIPSKEVEEGFYSRIVSKVGKNANDITVDDLLKFQSQLEDVIMDIGKGTCTLKHFKDGCVEIHWYIPTNCTEHAYRSANVKRHKFRELSLLYLQIGSFPTIYDPFSTHLSQPIASEPQPPVFAGKTVPYICYQ